MAEATTEEEARVSMNWPVGLKEQVRALVGSRGVTAFTITAVKKELDLRLSQRTQQPDPQAPGGGQRAEEAAVEPTERPPEEDVVHATQPVAEEPEERTASEPVRDTRGETVAVAPPTLGVAAKFSSSSDALEELRRKGAELGIRTASELPKPAVLRDDDPPRTEDVDRPQPAYQAPEPTKVAAVERVEAEQVPNPAPARTFAERNLDDIEIDF